VTVSAPGTLQLDADETIGSLAGDGALNGPFTLVTGGNNASTTFSGPMTIDGLTKIGTGTFNLAGTGTLGTGMAVKAGILTIGGAYASPANSVASGATLNVLAPGALTGNVAAAAGSTTVVNGSVTGDVANAGALSGTGTVNGRLTNTGTLSPGNGDIGVFHVNGAFSQGAAGTLAVEVTPNNVAGTGYDQLSVTGAPGTAALDGTLAVNLANGLGTPAGPYVAGTTYDVVSATGGVTGNLTVTGNVLSPFVRLDPTGIVTLAGTTQAFRLTVVRTPYATGIGAGATGNEIAVANGFQGLVNGATGATAALVSNVDVLNATDARTFFQQLSPEAYGAYANSMLNTGNLFSRQLTLQTHETPNMLPGFDLWLRGYGSWNKAHDRGDLFGSKINTWGITGGGTYRSGGFYAGLAGGYSKDRIHFRYGNSNGRNESWQAGGYVGYDTGSGFDADLQVDYIHGNITSIRDMNGPALAGRATVNTRAHEWKIVPTVGYGFNLGGLELRPFVGLDHTTGRVNGFTETGLGAADLTVNAIRTKRTDLLAGFDLRANPNSTISPYGRLAWRHNLGHQRDTISARFDDNAASAFTVDYFAASKNQFDVDAGLNFQASPNFAIFAGYQGTFRKGMDSHGFSAGVSYSFGAPPAPPPPPVAAPPPPPPPPPPAPATKACPDGSTVGVDQSCPVPPPPAVAPQGERG
jgi:outer membrane autotransporter protein